MMMAFVVNVFAMSLGHVQMRETHTGANVVYAQFIMPLRISRL
jgi:hypothetical protein